MTNGIFLVKLQQARKVFDDFLNHIEKEDESDLEKENGKIIIDILGMKNAEVDDKEPTTNVSHEDVYIYTNTNNDSIPESKVVLEVAYYN